MQRNRVIPADRVENHERLTAAHVVLGVHFEPRHRRPFLQHGAVMREPQADTRRCRDHEALVLPPANFWQSPFGTSTNEYGSRSRVACPAQVCWPSAQSFLPPAATPYHISRLFSPLRSI